MILAALYLLRNPENEINNCINAILTSSTGHSLYIETKNRGNTPLLKGKADKKNKELIKNLIEKKCGPINLQDLAEESLYLPITTPSLSFEIDTVNNIIVINGSVNSKTEVSNIINSFNNALNDTQQAFTLKHDFKTDRAIRSSEYDIFVTLIIPSINNVQLAQISINNDQLTIKGLVRDKNREQETINQLTALFAEDLQIINQLELVVKHEPIIEKFKFEITPLPTIEEQ